MNDVFISYTSADQAWGEWIAWVLEANGHTVRLRPWDFALDGNLILNLHMAASPGAQQFLVVLSKHYLELQSPIGGWPEEFEEQLSEAGFKLLSVLVEDCQPSGILADLPQLSLVEVSEVEAETQLLAAWSACITDESIISKGQSSQSGLTGFQVGAEASVMENSEGSILALPEDYEYRNRLKLRRRMLTVQGYREPLTDDLSIEMIQIPAGHFVMGSPEDELDRNSNEGPQHEVQVPEFFLGKYPVTQAEWRWVAENVPQINRELTANPSHFKGDRHPVESVSWYDAVEFCDRLSLHTGRTYRLPSEAEWEYACRGQIAPPEGANSQYPPFHFGETITTTVANYDGTDDPDGAWSGSYGRGPKGEFRQKTTPVEHFEVTNAFGLCDLYGNVWEWCLDHWHDSYEGAPTDGSAWVDEDAEENQFRILRGGAWYNDPRSCRSAYRGINDPRGSINGFGFRVLCVAPRALE
ncbi:SUMF1/EgtB/PvdO family nonheme iron enzyme [Oscillatoria sp. CS-180]|uniref:SUMF1/EgtB/PvdO family nonheme iron enzyme n=1 Tax=Oscillatoria sp. CS-180 TaxID=3021720 RepID=UPI00232E8596|nr:SUMF1/EgtB/PvdO family nonheme iron enzyme [Oscillatoria sp. CS-180]MDB9526272.1 SUMF1/EgtB/PvdO family nonheme iron enzyme [Oscillatoria sp. CS-180]